jgi:Fic family protein
VQPPYQLTPEILRLVVAIAELLGRIHALRLDKPSPQLRKKNRIRTIQSSVGIEGNTLSIDQVTALLDQKRVIGPPKDLLEVYNAIQAYQELPRFNPYALPSLLKAHGIMMHNLIPDSGAFRRKEVGIMAGQALAHMAPPAHRVPHLMADLFTYLQSSDELPLIKSCVFHYELEFIHPFSDGNGRMGRLWQTLLLMETHPVFEFLPLETLIQASQQEYYQALAQSDQAGASTPFLTYMLRIIQASLTDALHVPSPATDPASRMRYFLDSHTHPFTRKDYLKVFPELSTATASRDLRQAVDDGIIEKRGDKSKATYHLSQPHPPQ